MSKARATRYWRLALQERDDYRAQLLFLLANEAKRGVLCTSFDRRDLQAIIPQADPIYDIKFMNDWRKALLR